MCLLTRCDSPNWCEGQCENYKIYDKEMLAIMHAFHEWSHYLKGATIPTEVLTDHQNLTYFQKLNQRQAQWVTDLQDYNFVIKY